MDTTTGTVKTLPQYECHKIVGALQIKDIQPSEVTADMTVITPAEEDYAPFEVDAEFMAKHSPQIGGYCVEYQDGYRSFSPAEAFESGYTLIS